MISNKSDETTFNEQTCTQCRTLPFLFVQRHKFRQKRPNCKMTAILTTDIGVVIIEETSKCLTIVKYYPFVYYPQHRQQ